jgi:DNA-binding response OmpR family regulator
MLIYYDLEKTLQANSQLSPASSSMSGAKGSRATILVVDDDVKILRFLRISLNLAGYRVITATNGEDALKLLDLEHPVIMVLDMLMPGMDGYQVLQQIRTVSKMPVIVISAHNLAAEKALNLGANIFLPKPLIPDELIRKIELLLR